MNSTIYCGENQFEYSLGKYGIEGVSCDGIVSAKLGKYVELV